MLGLQSSAAQSRPGPNLYHPVPVSEGVSVHLVYGAATVLAVVLFGYAFLRSRTGYIEDAMDHQGMVIGIQKKDRVGEGEVDLDEMLYDPLVEEIDLWLGDPPIFNDGAFLPWADLKSDRPDVVADEVPDDLEAMLDEAEELSSKVTQLRGIVSNMTVAELKEQGDELKEERGIKGKGGTKIRLDVDGSWAKYLELSGIWLSGSTVGEWVEDYVAREHPDADEWEVVVLVADEEAGGVEAAEQVAEGVFEYLESRDVSTGLRDEAEQLQAIGEKLMDRIEAERGG